MWDGLAYLVQGSVDALKQRARSPVRAAIAWLMLVFIFTMVGLAIWVRLK